MWSDSVRSSSALDETPMTRSLCWSQRDWVRRSWRGVRCLEWLVVVVNSSSSSLIGDRVVLLLVIDFSNLVGSCQIFMRAVRALIWMDVTVSYGGGKQVIVGDPLSG